MNLSSDGGVPRLASSICALPCSVTGWELPGRRVWLWYDHGGGPRGRIFGYCASHS